MLGPDVCRGPFDVRRLVKRYGMVKQPRSGRQGSTGCCCCCCCSTPPELVVGPLLLPDVDPCFSSRVPRAGAIRLKYSLCIVLLFILSSFLISLPYQKARYLSPRHHALCRRWNKNPLS